MPNLPERDSRELASFHSKRMYREMRRCGDPNFAQLTRARECSRQMRERGELRGDLRLSRRARLAKLFERY